MTKEKQKKDTSKKNSGSLGVLFIIILFLIILIGGVIFVFWFSRAYTNKIYPGVSLSRYDFSGVDYVTALETIEAPVEQLEKEGLKFVFEDQKVTIMPHVASVEGGLVYDIFSYELKATIDQAYDIGRGQAWYQNYWQQLLTWLNKAELQPQYELNQEELEKLLRENFSEYESPVQEAELVVDEDLNLTIKEGTPGKIFNYQQILEQVEKQIQNFNFNPVKIELLNDYPRINQKNAQYIIELAEMISKNKTLSLTYEDKTWEIIPEVLTTWLAFKWDDASVFSAVDRLPNLTNVAAKSSEISLGLHDQRVTDYLNTIAEEINIPVQEGKFYLNPEGKMIQFQESQTGLGLKAEDSITQIEQNYITARKYQVALVVDIAEPEVTNDNVAEMGIVELIGSGESNFSGSPRNRVHNIGVGSDALNGLLIKPDQEFSILKALGKTDGSAGYLPELVIKGRKLKAEYGGGLCQVATTMFRTAMGTGLPVTQRANHSFQVSYYADANGKPGKDATIYDPAPDLKFVNDTGHYILLRSRIEGSNLVYEMWGTNDGRQIEIGDISTYGYKSAPATVEEETNDLGPGERKCSGPGVSAEFDYKVTYPDGEIKDQTFTSVYRPFSMICLVGKAAEEPAPEEPTAEKSGE